MKAKIILLILVSLLISIQSFEFIKYTEENDISLITISRPKV